MNSYLPTRLFRSISLSLVLGALFAGTLASAQDHNNSTDAINDLNVLFRGEYADARQAHLGEANTIIIVRGDRLVMLRGAERTEGSTVHPNYHDLKAISHGPLALFCILGKGVDRPLTKQHYEKLNSLGASLEAAANDLDTAFEDPRQRARQADIVARCVAAIEKIVKDETCSADDLDALVDSLRRPLVLNAAEAARMRIDNYHAQMKRWRSDLSDAAWQEMYVIIPGATLPRENSLAVRYFAKLFEQAGEGNRVVYAEAQFDEPQGLRLLGTHLLDSSIGKAFFDDSSRMKRDLLGPFANAYLDALDFEGLQGAPRTDGE